MSTSKEMIDTPEQRASDDVKTSTAPTVKSDVTSGEQKDGMGGYVVCVLIRLEETPN
jgi:predicted homoserine dehydrogenase-like protein